MTVATAAPRRWLFGPASDLLLGCGLLYALFFVAMLAVGDAHAFMPVFLAPLLVMLFSTPHYGATILRVYDQRRERRRYALFSVWATLVIAAWFVLGQHVAIAGSWMLTLYLTWSPWHYTGQNYGISVMLLGRRGVALDAKTKRWLHLAFVSSYLLYFGVIHESAAWASIRALPLEAEGIRFIPLGVPRLVMQIGVAAWVVTIGGVLWRLTRLASLADLGPALLLIVSQALWFALPAVALHWQLFGGREPLGPDVQVYFLVWIALAHALQYLWITAYYARASQGWKGTLPFLGRTFVAGAAIWTLPAIVFAPHLLGGVGYEAGLALLVASAVNIHHFVLDGAIWKLRDGPIARVLIRSEADDGPPDAEVGTWARRALWTVAAVGALVMTWAFAAEYVLLPRALEAQQVARAGALLDSLDWMGRDSSRSRGQLAGVALRAGDRDAAVANFERSIALRPTVEAYGALIETLAMSGRFEEAARHCEALLALAPENPNALRLAGAVYQRVGRGAEARELAQRAASLPPPSAEPRALRPALY